jgi:hypothetical protein
MTTGTLARYAAVHWLEFAGVRLPAELALGPSPADCASFKIGPDGPVGSDGRRLPSNVWCGVALFESRAAAEKAFAAPERFLPAGSRQSWHALLLPVAHRGECNHFESGRPRTLFEIAEHDPGGPLFVMTTAGFVPPPDLARVVDFRLHVDKVRDSLAAVGGCVASEVFTPHTLGDDGVTMTLWKNDAAMIDAMYRPGIHRTQVDRHKRDNLADRTSFTRFRVLATRGQWGGSDSLERARGAGA